MPQKRQIKIKASANSFKRFTSRLLKLSFSLSMHLFPRMNVMLDFMQKQKYRGMFETQKSRNKTSSGDIGLNIRTLASPKVGQDQVSGGVSVPCWHTAPVAFEPHPFERCQSSCEEHGTSEHYNKILSTVGVHPSTPHGLQITNLSFSPLDHNSLDMRWKEMPMTFTV